MSIVGALSKWVLPRYRTDAERLARLERLRHSLMGEWEGNLEWGSGNVLNGVPTSRIVGLVDIVRWVMVLRQSDPPNYAEPRLTESIDAYLRDLDFAKTDAGRDL